MTSNKAAGFPDLGNKLQAPTKKSLFERQKAEAEAKRLREEAETAAVYQDFVKSFDDDDDHVGPMRDEGTRGGFGGGRHFGRGGGVPTGPGQGLIKGRGAGGKGLGSGPGSLGPPPLGIGKKRTFEKFAQGDMRKEREERGLLAFEDYEHESAPSKALRTSDDEDGKASKGREEERAIAKPTLRLACLPPGTSPAVIKTIIPTNLVVENVRVIPPSGPGQNAERKSMTAIVTLAKETAANDIDTAVNSLQNKYLGYGYYLNLHRHLSSAAISSTSTATALGTTTTSHPFGAKPVVLPSAGRGGPLPHQRGFAPPTSYGPPMPHASRSGPLLHVPVQPPSDIRELRLIHKTVESLLTHGPEFEALLMSRSSVQKEEKWAWLWDARSIGGIWYRWRLWEVLTGTHSRNGQGKYLPLFEGASAWKQPDASLSYEYTTKIREFVSDSDYVSSEEEGSGDEGRGRGAPVDATDEGKAFLNPLEKAKITHLLSRLPTSTGMLRKGDVARVTAFAISHAGRGADEIVAAIISNIGKPFACTSANPDWRKDKEDSANDETEEDSDTSSASLIGIYIVSDILSSSSTSGIRHAWRYRQLFENELKRRKVFEGLGRMERRYNWGRLRAEKWKRSVSNILSLWEGWCVFLQESQDHFVNVFNNPPLLEEEQKEVKEKEGATKEKGKSKWKAVEEVNSNTEARQIVDGEPMGQKDVFKPMLDDEDLDGEPMEEDIQDIDGAPMVEDDSDNPDVCTPTDEPQTEPEQQTDKASLSVTADSVHVGQQKQRPRAVDMFADSDGDE